ncbi:MAG: GatB/YqeY domain-containing protein [Bacteroides sp.]|nr:GatB/YqeY domain-containing protein [Bacteroides sp.]MDD2644791.1 GatB/YqeY domain-containing protein [Bacteroides sp.]MDD4055589.1 GatB/YqeY domain-containing protein [Bacteroides sp.]MDD4719421.1 GatB/YqeY domain-containing protein [Bacteroides sp.]NLI64675.1 GatB/YqeY domain-containing protein [Bacteroidales bacterium]
MNLFDTVSEDIKKAMKAKNKVALQTLRNVKKAFIEANTQTGANEVLSDEEALRIIQKLVKQGKDSATIYKEQDREDLADEELAQVEILEEYLPKQMSKEELKEALKKLVDELNATSMKDMGKVMGTATQKFAGKAEGRMISQIVKELLS